VNIAFLILAAISEIINYWFAFFNFWLNTERRTFDTAHRYSRTAK